MTELENFCYLVSGRQIAPFSDIDFSSKLSCNSTLRENSGRQYLRSESPIIVVPYDGHSMTCIRSLSIYGHKEVPLFCG